MRMPSRRDSGARSRQAKPTSPTPSPWLWPTLVVASGIVTGLSSLVGVPDVIAAIVIVLGGVVGLRAQPEWRNWSKRTRAMTFIVLALAVAIPTGVVLAITPERPPTEASGLGEEVSCGPVEYAIRAPEEADEAYEVDGYLEVFARNGVECSEARTIIQRAASHDFDRVGESTAEGFTVGRWGCIGGRQGTLFQWMCVPESSTDGGRYPTNETPRIEGRCPHLPVRAADRERNENC